MKTRSMKKSQIEVKWERLLWKRQPYPDNYMEEDSGQETYKVEKLLSLQAYYGCSIVTQQIVCCFILVAAYSGIDSKNLSYNELLEVTAVLCGLAYFITKRYIVTSIFNGNVKLGMNELRDDFTVTFFAIILCWSSSPIVKTLTASIASDTIQAMAIAFLFLHLMFHNYGMNVAICNPTMSCNLGLFTSVCLASRLQQNEDVFALSLLSVVLFTLVPIFRVHCQESFGKTGCLLFTMTLLVISAFGIWNYLPFIWIGFIVLIIFVNFIVPSLFLVLVRNLPDRKNRLGPCYEATIE